VRDLGLWSLAVIAVVVAAWTLPSGRDGPATAREMVAPGYLPADAPRSAPRAPPPRAGATSVSFDLLSYFDYDPEADVIPDDVLALDGKRIELVGVMYYGVDDPDRVTGFYLMPNHMVCCYGTFRLNEAVEVELRPGLKTRYVLDYFLVRGTLHVGAIRDEEDRVLALYRITDAEADVLP
jgi:hypothetical protein